MNEDKIVAALRARYRSPEHVLRQLGLDAGLLREGDDMRARGDGGEGESEAVEEALLDLAEAALAMSPHQHEALLERASRLTGSGDVSGWIEETLERAQDRGRLGEDRKRRVADARRRRAHDAPPYFEGVPRSRAEGMSGPAEDRRRRGRYASDSRPGSDDPALARALLNAGAVRSPWNP